MRVLAGCLVLLSLVSCSPQTTMLARIFELETQLEESQKLNVALIECALSERAAKEACEAKRWRP